MPFTQMAWRPTVVLAFAMLAIGTSLTYKPPQVHHAHSPTLTIEIPIDTD